MKNKYELWLESLSLNNMYPYLLEDSGEVKLFQVKSQYNSKHNINYFTTYHVWNKNNWNVFTDYVTAYTCYMNEAMEIV